MSDIHGAGFSEVADSCFLARYAAWDVTIGAVVGADGVLVVDTSATPTQARVIADDLRRVAGPGQVRWVVNTHQHFDHVLGNSIFPHAAVHAHENAAAGMPASLESIRDQIRADPSLDPDHPAITTDVLDEVLTAELRLPEVTFSSVGSIDLGSRYVELVHPGRGHTDGDIIVRVPDSELLFAGDLIEQSGPPSYGDDCFPLDWSATLDLMVGLMTDTWTAVPGHGTAVDREFVKDQRTVLSDVSGLIRSLHAQGVPLDQALGVGGSDWPLPPELLVNAVQRGYEQLSAAGAPARPAEPASGTATLPLA